MSSAAATTTENLEPLWPRLFRVAWMSIVLGIALEVLILMLAAYSGTAGDGPRPAIAELAQKVSWALFVCAGLALGTAVSKLREVAMGGLGLLVAPAAFAAAKAIHKGLGQALGIVAPGMPLSVPVLTAALKALEYGVLGAVLGHLSRTRKGLTAFVAAGSAVGATFGLALIWIGIRGLAAPPGAIDLAARGINEMLFPIGCSIVIYAAEAMGRRLERPRTPPEAAPAVNA